MPYNNETIQETRCPKCQGHMWDNRKTKLNPKQPDFKCKDKQCDGVIWPPRDGASRMPQPSVKPVATSGKEPYSLGGPLPYETESQVRSSAQPHLGGQLDTLFTVYDVCLEHAYAKATGLFGKDVTDEAVAAMAATLFIQAAK